MFQYSLPKNQIQSSLISTNAVQVEQWLGLKIGSRESKDNDYWLLMKNQLAFCWPRCVRCFNVCPASAVLGLAVFLGEVGQAGAHCRLRGLPENTSSNFSTTAHQKEHSSSATSTPASLLGLGEQAYAPHISEWIDLKLKRWQDRQASCLVTWHYQAHLLRRPLQICNSREAALSAFHFQRMQLGLSNTLKIERAQSFTVQFHSGNLASLRNPCSSITIKKGQRKKHLRWSSYVWPHLEGPQSDLQASAKGRERHWI